MVGAEAIRRGAIVRKVMMVALIGLMTVGSFGTAEAVGSIQEARPSMNAERLRDILMAQRRSCKAASSCEEAVEMWCGGYSRADADGDGIPCENVCRSRSQVESIKQRIGC